MRLVESMSESAVIAERIRAALAEPIEAQSRMHQMSASVGVAQTSTGGTAEEDLLRRADLAMYLAKERGRDRVEFSPRTSRNVCGTGSAWSR